MGGWRETDAVEAGREQNVDFPLTAAGSHKGARSRPGREGTCIPERSLQLLVGDGLERAGGAAGRPARSVAQEASSDC